MAYSKPFNFTFHKQEDFSPSFNFNDTPLQSANLLSSAMLKHTNGSDPFTSRLSNPPSSPSTFGILPPAKPSSANLAKYTEHAAHASPGDSSECKICRTLQSLDVAAFYWSLMAMYGLPYRSSPPTPTDARAKSPMGSVCSDSQPPSPASSTDTSEDKDGAIYRCNVCQKSYSHPRFLNRHLQSHTPYKKHHCPRCGKGFNDAFDLKRHIRTHTGTRPTSFILDLSRMSLDCLSYLEELNN